MNWAFPHYRIVDGDTMNPDDLNLYYELIWGELQALTGFSFQVASLTVGTDIAESAAVRMVSYKEEVNHGIDITVPTPAPYESAMVVSGDVLVSVADFTWRVIESRTISTDTASLWIMFSFQQGISCAGGGTPTNSNEEGILNSARAGVQYAISIDGSVISETITGSGERATDVNGEGYGGQGANEALVIDCVWPVVAGNHTIEVVWRMPRGKDYEQPDADDYFMVLNRELIILELR